MFETIILIFEKSGNLDIRVFKNVDISKLLENSGFVYLVIRRFRRLEICEIGITFW